MKIVIFGLSISSSWGNGHATLWRGLCRELTALGHQVIFFERDVPYYAEHRDSLAIPNFKLILYSTWADISPLAARQIKSADVAVTTSYCTDALRALELMKQASCLRVFYDLDTPVTFARLDAGEHLNYIGEAGLQDYHLVLSFTGGSALELLRTRLGAKRTAPLYGSVDPTVHFQTAQVASYRSELSYLGTYSADRQEKLHELFIAPARLKKHSRFLLAGAQYPQDFPWEPNIYFLKHLPPVEHAAFFSSSRVTLNITRKAMAAAGFCPSGRLFEAAACGTPILSDYWDGLETFFEPGKQILTAASATDALLALEMDDAQLARIARAGRERVMEQHTAACRAREMQQSIQDALCTSAV